MVNPNELVPGISVVKYKHMPYLFVRHDAYRKLFTIKDSKKKYIHSQEVEVDELYFDTNNICDKIQITKTDKDTLCIIDNIHLPFHLIQKEMEKHFKKPAIINDIDSLIGYIIK